MGSKVRVCSGRKVSRNTASSPTDRKLHLHPAQDSFSHSVLVGGRLKAFVKGRRISCVLYLLLHAFPWLMWLLVHLSPKTPGILLGNVVIKFAMSGGSVGGEWDLAVVGLGQRICSLGNRGHLVPGSILFALLMLLSLQQAKAWCLWLDLWKIGPGKGDRLPYFILSACVFMSTRSLVMLVLCICRVFPEC